MKSKKIPKFILLRLAPCDRELLEKARKVFQSLYLSYVPDPIPFDTFVSLLVVWAYTSILDGGVSQ